MRYLFLAYTGKLCEQMFVTTGVMGGLKNGSTSFDWYLQYVPQKLVAVVTVFVITVFLTIVLFRLKTW